MLTIFELKEQIEMVECITLNLEIDKLCNLEFYSYPYNEPMKDVTMDELLIERVYPALLNYKEKEN